MTPVLMYLISMGKTSVFFFFNAQSTSYGNGLVDHCFDVARKVG